MVDVVLHTGNGGESFARSASRQWRAAVVKRDSEGGSQPTASSHTDCSCCCLLLMLLPHLCSDRPRRDVSFRDE